MIWDGVQYDSRDPYWSPDGAWLAYRSNLYGDFDLFILNLLSREFRAFDIRRR